MAAKNFRKLFEPYTVKSMTLRNRIVMTPIGTNFAEHTGEVNERIIDYYKQRAKGGTGLITIEAASVYSPQGASGSYQLRIDHDNYIPGLYRLCESIHDCGSKISILLNHAGSVSNGKMTNIQPVSASDIPSRVGGRYSSCFSIKMNLHDLLINLLKQQNVQLQQDLMLLRFRLDMVIY